jgi:hypothetical protein
MGDVVEVAGRIGIVEIGGWRDHLALQGHDGDACLQPARPAQQVAGHGLGRADQQFSTGRVFTEEGLDGRGLQGVPQRRRRGMGVYIVHHGGFQFGAAQGILHRPQTALANSPLHWAPCW